MSEHRPDSNRNKMLIEEIRKGGVAHNEVVAAIVVMTPTGLQVAPEPPPQIGTEGSSQPANQPNTQPQQQE